MSSSPGSRTTDKFESSRKESSPQQLGRRPQLGLVLAACAMAYLLYLRRDQIGAQLMQLRAMAMRMLGMSVDDDEAHDHRGAIDPAIVMRKLVALRAKLYGVSSCGWTVRQLAEFAAVEKNATADLYKDCSDRAACPSHVTAFPTWEIDGNVMPPGYVKLEVLNAQADALLLLAKEQQQAAPPAEDSSKPKEAKEQQPPPPKEQEEAVTAAAEEEDLHTPPYEEEEEEEEKAAEKEEEEKAAEEVPPPPPPTPTFVPEETPTEEPSEEDASGAVKRRKRRARRG